MWNKFTGREFVELGRSGCQQGSGSCLLLCVYCICGICHKLTRAAAGVPRPCLQQAGGGWRSTASCSISPSDVFLKPHVLLATTAPWPCLVVETGKYILLFDVREKKGRPQRSQLKIKILLAKVEAKNGNRHRLLAVFGTAVGMGNPVTLWDVYESFYLTAESMNELTKWRSTHFHGLVLLEGLEV